VRMAPGPTFNVIGDVGGRPVIDITGAPTFATTGALDMTTVRESGGPRGGLTFVQAIGAWFSDSDAVVPQELLYRDDVTGEEVKQRQAALFTVSESNAIAAALNYLELPVRSSTIVTAVILGAPSDGIVEPGDVVLSVDGIPVSDAAVPGERIRSAPVGTSFALEVERNGTPQVLNVVSAPNPDNEGLPHIGLSLTTAYRGDFDIALNLEDIGGPSAGLIFALGIVDKLTPTDLTGGRAIAGTGTIDPAGSVGRVGGVRQKVIAAREAGAELFLLSPQQCPEIDGRIPAGLAIAAVATLGEAIAAIESWTAGGAVPGCPVRATSGE
jgi:PDZ domain-containing protein